MSLPPRWFSRPEPVNPATKIPSASGGQKVVIVGPCASGKSTLAAGLRALGFDAMPVAQEHSDIPTLWRHAEPDLVVALEVDLETIRSRRSEAAWPEWLYETQQRRLSQARDAAAMLIDAATTPAPEVLDRVAAFLRASSTRDQDGIAEAPDQFGENPEPA